MNLLGQECWLPSRHDTQDTGRAKRLLALSRHNLELAGEATLESCLSNFPRLARKLVDADLALALYRGDTGQGGRRFANGLGEVRGQAEEALLALAEELAERPEPAESEPNFPVRLLGLRLRFQDEDIGVLRLGRLPGEPGFTVTDYEALSMFAAQSGAALDNLRLRRKLQRLAILEEQDRIAKELHDGAIQSIYAVGLCLEDLALMVETAPQEARRQLEQAVGELNRVIRDLRSSIFNLGPLNAASVSLTAGLEYLARECLAHALLSPELQLTGVENLELPAELKSGLFQLVREALANASQHSRASRVEIHLRAEAGHLLLTVRDNGIGFDPARVARWRGLQEAQELAQELGGALAVESAPGQGAAFRVTLPIKS